MLLPLVSRRSHPLRLSLTLLTLLGLAACAEDATLTSPPLEVPETVGAAPSAFVPSLVFTRSQSVLGRGDYARLVAVDASGTPVPADDLEWASALPGVATVSSKGMVRGVSPGTTVITARSGSRIAQHSAVVVGGGSSALRVRPLGVSALAVGEVRELSATDGAGRRIAASAVSWSTSAAGVASVSPRGVLTARAPGHAVITIRRGEGVAQHGVLVGGQGAVDDDESNESEESEESEEAEGADPPRPAAAPVGTIPAFPGAEGWGAEAFAECRSLPIEVLNVTNTRSQGPGSFHQAMLDARSDRFSFIVFRTGGRIDTPSGSSRLNASCVYVAGQTAPGDGVMVGGAGVWLRGSGGDVSDIVLRYLRFRGARTNLHLSKGSRVVLDHLSLSWANLYGLALQRYEWSWSRPMSDISVQNSIVSEALGAHPTGFVVGGPMKDRAAIGMRNISIHRNLLASNSHRNPMLAADNAVVINNVIYNWRNGAGMMNRRGTVDWVANFAKRGPMGRREQPYIVNPYCDRLGGDFSIYVAGNIGPAGDNPSGDNWTGPNRQIACMRGSGDYDGQEVPARWRRTRPQNWAAAPIPITLRSARRAYDAVVGDVGANARITCDGSWVPAVDVTDARVISETRNGTGPRRAPEAPGPWPRYRSGTPCRDADGDGLPDRWEERHFGRATQADPAAVGRGGYLLMEHYLNGTDPR